jgi:hypothetical protein
MSSTSTVIETRDHVMARAKSESLISPRFYTTDFEAMNKHRRERRCARSGT